MFVEFMRGVDDTQGERGKRGLESLIMKGRELAAIPIQGI